MTTTSPIFEINNYGQSIWMDNLSRDLIESGELKQLITSRDVQGITSNSAIFEKAIAGNTIYDADIEAGIRAGKPVNEIYESLVFSDIPNACDILRPVYDPIQGLDGYVSLEIDLDQVMADLLDDGIDKFVKPFDSPMDSLVLKIQQLTPA